MSLRIIIGARAGIAVGFGFPLGAGVGLRGLGDAAGCRRWGLCISAVVFIDEVGDALFVRTVTLEEHDGILSLPSFDAPEFKPAPRFRGGREEGMKGGLPVSLVSWLFMRCPASCSG